MKLREIDKKKLALILIDVFVLLFFFWIMYNVPYCHDDWKWGSLEERLNGIWNSWDGYGGRFLGNVFALIVTRLGNGVKTIVMSLGIFGLYVTIRKTVMIQKEEEDINLCFLSLASFLFMLIIPKTLFSEVYAWPCGFSNYLPSVILLLIQYIWIARAQIATSYECSLFQCFFIGAIGCAGQLFSENITIINVAAILIVIAIMVCLRRMTNAFGKLLGSMLLGNVIGAVIMFSNSAYWQKQISGYREVSILLAISNIRDEIVPFIFLQNVVVNLVLTVGLSILLAKKEKKRISYALIVVMASYTAYSFLRRFDRNLVILGDPVKNGYLELVFSTFFFLAVVISMYLSCEKRVWILSLYVWSIAYSTPLSVVSTISPRCFFATYLLYVVVCLSLLMEITSVLQVNDYRVICAALIGILLLFTLLYGRVFKQVGCAAREREAMIQSSLERGDDEIVLPQYPYREFFGGVSYFANGTEWEDAFKLFYNVPENVVVSFEFYD